MLTKRYSLTSLALGAALLSGCGGNSFENTSYGTYQNALPAAYGIEATAANGNISGPVGGPFFYETSGIGSADGKTAYLTEASDFAVLKNPNSAKLLSGTDPNNTGKVPLGFSGNATVAGTAGEYIDANTVANPAVPVTVAPGASVVFRAAISNGVSSSTRSAVPITYNGVSLSSNDPQWALGTLPMTFNYLTTGPFANATYVTGTPVSSGQGTPTPFTLPFTTTGIHTVILTVSDDAGQQTATTFGIPVVASSDAAVLAGIAATVPAGLPKGTTATVTSATASITNPITGAAAQGTADAQSIVLLFAAPGAQTLSVTAKVAVAGPNGQVVSTLTQTGSFPITLTPGGTVRTAVTVGP